MSGNKPGPAAGGFGMKAGESGFASGDTPYSVWLAIIAGAVVMAGMYWDQDIAGPIGFCLVVLTVLMLLSPVRWKYPLWITILVILAMAGICMLPALIRVKDKTKAGETKQNLHAIQLALERYATDNDTYPLVIDTLRTEGYMPEFPGNPFVKQVSNVKDSRIQKELNRMQPLGADYYPEEYRDRLGLNGNFCYIPRIVRNDAGELEVTGYTVMCFAVKHWHPRWFKPGTDSVVELYQLSSWK